MNCTTLFQRVGKVTINELRKRGMTGEELRCLMWGRASISTPVRTRYNLYFSPTYLFFCYIIIVIISCSLFA